MRNSPTTLFLTLFSVLILGACGGDSTTGSGSGPGTTFQGLIAFDSGQDGSVSIEVPEGTFSTRLNARTQGSGTTNITGECIFPGGSVPLEGSLTASSGAFTLSGGGFTFSGSFDLETGSFTGSLTENGTAAGTFSGVDATTEAVQAFCGTFSAEDSGIFLVVVSGDSMTGSYAGELDSGTLDGTVSGSSFTLDASGGGSATGTISGNSVSGSILNEAGENIGSFQGSTDTCSN